MRLAALLLLAGHAALVSAQPVAPSQEVSEVDGQPVLLKHLPDYETVGGSAKFTTDKNELRAVIGTDGWTAIDVLEFPIGTEAVTAAYPEGRLMIVEYTNPQSSIEADQKIQQLSANGGTSFVYRRIGNYNAFVFGSSDAAAASVLLDKIKYQKTVQWLGEDPYILKRLERYMLSTSRDIMVSTVKFIVFGLAGSVLAGIAAGFIFFRMRDQKRTHRTAFTDAGGMTRLNLDGLSE
jgi:hypothetical protein